MSALLRLAEFQAAWWGAALLARAQLGAAAALPPALYVALHLARSPRRAASLVLVVVASVLGALVDHALMRAEVTGFHPALLAWPCPPFMVALWAAFACTLETSLAPLAARPALGAVLGGLGGVLSYRGAASLGVLTISPDAGRATLWLGLAWAVATPLLGLGARALRSESAVRRARTVPLVLLLAAACLPMAPALLLAALAADAVRALRRRRAFMGVRLVAFGLTYLAAEAAGIAALTVAGMGRADDVTRRTYAIQARWTATLFGAVRRIFGLRFEVEGDAAVRPGPVVVLVRHTSIIDTLLPSVFLTRAHGLKLRFVLKRELLADPCLDIAGSRLPNHFVARDGQDTSADLAAIQALAHGMRGRDDEGALIYPEGTRFSPRKRERALKALAGIDPALAAQAGAMQTVLPPKPAGVMALLDGAPDADAVFMAHTGLEDFGRIDDIWRSAQPGRTVKIKVWRVPRAQISLEERDRTRWLYGQWQALDAWVVANAAK